MDSARIVGRVGALAVALGIGSAVGGGVAAADTSSESGSDSSSRSSETSALYREIEPLFYRDPPTAATGRCRM